jgi:hypothetical protein
MASKILLIIVGATVHHINFPRYGNMDIKGRAALFFYQEMFAR